MFFSVCHTSSCSSSWTRLFTKSWIYQESTFEVCEAIISVIKDQVEITSLSTIHWNQLMWRGSSLLCDKAVRIVKSQTYVFADSVLCLGNMSDQPVEAWKEQD